MDEKKELDKKEKTIKKKTNTKKSNTSEKKQKIDNTKKDNTKVKKTKNVKNENKIDEKIESKQEINLKETKDEVIENKKEILEKNVSKDERIATKIEKNKKNDNSFSLTEVVGLLLASVIITFIIGVVLGNGYAKDNNYSSNRITDEIIHNYNIIKEQYPEVLDKDLLNGAIKGMLGTVDDPYASFIESDSNLDLEIKGIYEGLGIQIITYENGEIYVSSVFENSSAAEVGIKVGDKLLQIDDLKLEDKTGTDFANYVRDSKNKEFKVTVLRDNKELEYTVEKTVTIIPSVFTNIFEQNDKKIGYLQVTIFSEKTLAQYEQKLDELEKENIDSLIIDLRGNSGGVLATVNGMLSTMMDSSKIVYKTDADGEIETFYSTGKVSKEYDIVVLVDGESASASEIMAAALRDNLNAKLVGTKTYGKGTVQQVKELSSGDEYKITTKKWLTPKGECVDKVGLTPDYIVELDENYYMNPSNETDNQLQKALEILK